MLSVVKEKITLVNDLANIRRQLDEGEYHCCSGYKINKRVIIKEWYIEWIY